jgi:hypothetical protein
MIGAFTLEGAIMTAVLRHRVGAFFVVLTFVAGDSAHAQLRSLTATKRLALESSPGSERQTNALRTHETLNLLTGLIVPTAMDVPAEDRAYFARCIVRAPLPKPLTVALDCYDAAGAYFATKRAANVDELATALFRAIKNGSPASRPLHSYRYIYVEPFDDRHKRFDLLVQLLQKASVYTVLQQSEALAMPEAARDSILRCRIHPVGIISGSVVGRTVGRLLLLNMNDEPVAAVIGEGKWVAFVTSEARIQRGLLESAVQALIRARQDDEVTYGPAAGLMR